MNSAGLYKVHSTMPQADAIWEQAAPHYHRVVMLSVSIMTMTIASALVPALCGMDILQIDLLQAQMTSEKRCVVFTCEIVHRHDACN